MALLIYAYATGTRSSRKIEARLIEDIACRFIAANETPDHATVDRRGRGSARGFVGRRHPRRPHRTRQPSRPSGRRQSPPR
ncbi:MAG: transposase [Actinobacteria bacterium]|nr:transposase [Actinomycetota bacterium]